MITKHPGPKGTAVRYFLCGAAVGAALMFAYARLETGYWRSPGELYAEIPRLHAWAVRLMDLGGPGRDGAQDYQVPKSEWAARGGTLKECFAGGADESLIQYHVRDKTLSGVYRCKIGDMTGELEVGLLEGYLHGEIESSYEFRMLDSSTAAPMQPIGVFGR